RPEAQSSTTGSKGELGRILRLLYATYHPRNQYLFHLDRFASQTDRDQLALKVQSVPIFRAAQNVHLIGKTDFVYRKGSSSILFTLPGASILLRLSTNWDWFISLTVDDYPLLKQDDLLHIMSFLPKDLNFVNHSSYIGWKESKRLKQVIVDPELYLSDKNVMFYAAQKRVLPNAYRLFTDLQLVQGNLQGVGLFIGTEPRTGHLVVMSCVGGNPAARAGIHEGDELVEINGEKFNGVDTEAAVQKLRGRVGTTVTGNDLGSDASIREVKLPREFIKVSPISTATIPHRTPYGHLTKTGYVKLSAFSQTAAADMENAIKEMKSQGVHSYILDLRNNPLDGDETLVNSVDREGNLLPINMVDGNAITHDPLVVLVNEGSASASEILVGALHDNRRATLVGHRTFGKGKIQSVTELRDGSALFVTVAKYLSPALHDIDQVGIAPDVQCTTEMLNSPKDSMLKEQKSSVSSLEADSCVLVAEHELDIQESKGTAS
ncbi:hypothetical protein ABKV19_007699, partial [Rosa sericea]